MRQLAPILTFATILAFLTTGASSASAHRESSPAVAPPANLVHSGVLTFGVSLADPPQDFLLHGKPGGFDIDIGTALAREMGLKAQFVNLAFAGLFPALAAHKFDAAISGIGITPPRRKVYLFVPYFIGGQRMLARKAEHLYFTDDSQLCGHSVATLTGSVEASDLNRYNASCPGARKMQILVYPNFNEDLEQLRKGTVQVIDVDWPVSAYDLLQYPGVFVAASPIVSGNGPKTPPNQEGIMLRKGDSVLHAALSSALAKLERNGTYERILRKWNLQDGDIRTYGSYSAHGK